MVGGGPVTEIQRRYAEAAGVRRLLFYLVAAVLVLGLAALVVIVYLVINYSQFSGRQYLAEDTHFKYGSIGAELANGMPYKLFVALPQIFPEQFKPERNYSHFGFIYETQGAPDPNLPIGFARGNRHGVDVAWFNCAVCHTGQVKLPGESAPTTILGMPANTVDLHAFFLALFEMAVDKRFSWENETLRKEVRADDMGVIERILWEWIVLPNTRATLIKRRSELLPLLNPELAPRPKIEETSSQSCQPAKYNNRPASRYCRDETNYLLKSHDRYWPSPKVDREPLWGPGRVDTFNPYKLINFDVKPDCLRREERIGVTDFPSIFMQAPRGDQAMHLHWDGNNASLNERNLSAAIGAGVTEATVNHRSIERVAKWLGEHKPNPAASPHQPGPGVAAGKRIYMQACARCHGWQDGDAYVYEGERLGQVEPIERIGTDPSRLYSYTIEMEKYQKDRLFCNDPKHRFRFFKKTDGYANMPLDYLWTRAPYLHNGSVPTLKDLLEPKGRRPVTFVRGLTDLDGKNGGFVAPACDPAAYAGSGFCYDTTIRGNDNEGHLYGTDLSESEKHDLLQYLLTF